MPKLVGGGQVEIVFYHLFFWRSYPPGNVHKEGFRTKAHWKLRDKRGPEIENRDGKLLGTSRDQKEERWSARKAGNLEIGARSGGGVRPLNQAMGSA